MSDYVQVCGRCGSSVVNNNAYKATPGYAMSAGCQGCNPNIKSDDARYVAALQALEEKAGLRA